MQGKPVIMAMDNYADGIELLLETQKTLKDPNSEMIGFVKINDGAHQPDIPGPCLCSGLKKIRSDIGIFLDLKLADVSATVINTLMHYPAIDILTVTGVVSAQTLIKLRENFPDTKLALFSVPTDMSVSECGRRYGLPPSQKILNDVLCLEQDYKEARPSELMERPFDLVVCSPQEIKEVKQGKTLHPYGLICPGIRDKWMKKDHQERTTGVQEAIELGASYVVMGSQLLKGNPEKGVSPRESREKTNQEIAMMELEGGGHA